MGGLLNAKHITLFRLVAKAQVDAPRPTLRAWLLRSASPLALAAGLRRA